MLEVLQVPPSRRATETVARIGSDHADLGDVAEGSPIPIGRTVWYRFTPTTSTNVTIDTANSDADFDTIVAVYTGSSLSTLTPVECNDDTAGGSLQAQVSFAATAGMTYQIQIGGYNHDFGNLVVNFTPPAPGAPPARAASAAVATKPAPPRDPVPLEAE